MTSLCSLSGVGERVNIINIWSQKSNPGRVVFQGTGTYMWLSHDFGETFFPPVQTPARLAGSGVKSFKFHPKNDGWLLLLVKRPDCKQLDKLQMECPHDLWLTKDLYSPEGWAGKWQNLTANAQGAIAGFVDFDWGLNTCPSQNCPGIPAINENSIFATKYQSAGSYDQPWDADLDFAVSVDFFASVSTHVRCGNAFEVLGRSIYMAVANSCPTEIDGSPRASPSPFARGITLYTSTDAGATFTQACLPIALKQEGYELLETHDGTGAVLIVDYLLAASIPASSVYTAGPHHALFSLSLTNVYHADFGFATDFSRIEGVPGVYISNQMLPRDPSSSSEPATEAESDYQAMDDFFGSPLVESRISFNGGGHWQRLAAPTAFRNSQCDRCDGNALCYLHLHGMSSWDSMAAAVPAIYSNPSAPGMIMSTGNVGPKGVGLDDNDGLCTWLSTDSGVSWTDVGVGPYIYEFADWGGVIVMAQHPGRSMTPADEVLVSQDYGRCWTQVPLGTALLVDNIRIEPDGQQPRVILHGRACRKPSDSSSSSGGSGGRCSYESDDKRAQVEGLMYVIDAHQLDGAKMGQCDAATDYSPWTVPTETHTQRCVLGQTMQYTRRKQDSHCLNGAAFLRPPATNTTCNCTTEDVECDYGFMRSTAGTCAPISAAQMPSCPATRPPKSYAVSASGRRLVHGDVCSNVGRVIDDTDGTGKTTADIPGGIPDTTPGGSGSGPGSGSGSGSRSGGMGFFGRLFVTLLVVAVACGAACAWWVFLASEGAKDTVSDLAGSGGAFLASLWGWVSDRVSGVKRGPAGSGEELGYFQPLGDASGMDRDTSGGGSIFTLKNKRLWICLSGLQRLGVWAPPERCCGP
ncbi:MAG: hypothetical protein WDW38_003829 [Sanguina aurantia]